MKLLLARFDECISRDTQSVLLFVTWDEEDSQPYEVSTTSHHDSFIEIETDNLKEAFRVYFRCVVEMFRRIVTVENVSKKVQTEQRWAKYKEQKEQHLKSFKFQP